ncbi:hypothetical protein [Ktedonobacter sp. SOSP1-52]|uniref:hypothetical protein n=1 Tax=Ktedonobacter sp. SOSP1-52 TaxID=2778366 RepID=UPI001F34A1DC|nr:hypothetical protein [Ktedonobacter sp. SOSP1-52]
MPKLPGHVLIWSPEGSIYELHAPACPPVQFVSGIEESWFFWLTTHTAFSFGWGKTTPLSAWAHRHHEAVAWLSLEALDNDPTRFWVSLIAALRRCWPEIGARALALLQAPGSLSPGLTMLLNEMAGMHGETSPILLILDDYHVINESTIHTSLTFWMSICRLMCIWYWPVAWTRIFPFTAFGHAATWVKFEILICALHDWKKARCARPHTTISRALPTLMKTRSFPASICS